MDLSAIAVAAALAWGAGLRAYAVIFAVGIAGVAGWIELPEHLELLQRPIVLAASGFMTLVELFAEPLSNWGASLAEDAAVPLGLWLAFAHPLAFLALLAAFLLLAALLARLIWRGLKARFST